MEINEIIRTVKTIRQMVQYSNITEYINHKDKMKENGFKVVGTNGWNIDGSLTIKYDKILDVKYDER